MKEAARLAHSLMQASDTNDYTRAIVETFTTPEGKNVLRMFPVDGSEILHDDTGDIVVCWNALSTRQQRLLIDGDVPFIRLPEGDGCSRPASVLLEMVDDEAPGPRFYCHGCALAHLVEVTS